MEQSTLSEAEIAEFGDEYVLFLHVTSKVETDKYQDLLQEKGGGGFPFLAFLDSTGAVVAQHNGARSIEGFRKTGTGAGKFLALKSKAETGTPAEKVEFFMAGLGIGYFGADDIPSKLEELKAHMSDEQLAKVADKILLVEIEESMNSLRSEEDMLATGKKFSKMAAEGRIPPNDEQLAAYFWYFQLAYAVESENLKSAEGVVAEVKKRFTDPMYAGLIKDVEGKLAALREDLSEEGEGEEHDGKKEHDGEHDGDGHDG